MLKSGLAAKGYTYVNVDEGWLLGRDAKTNEMIEDKNFFPSGMKGEQALGTYLPPPKKNKNKKITTTTIVTPLMAPITSGAVIDCHVRVSPPWVAGLGAWIHNLEVEGKGKIMKYGLYTSRGVTQCDTAECQSQPQSQHSHSTVTAKA